VAFIGRVLAPNYVYFSSKGAVRSRQSILDQVFSEKYRLVQAERGEVNVYLTAKTAVVGSRWKKHGEYAGKEFHDDQRCSTVLAHKNAEWLVLAEQCTQVAPVSTE
jgi:hypothetical protein